MQVGSPKPIRNYPVITLKLETNQNLPSNKKPYRLKPPNVFGIAEPEWEKSEILEMINLTPKRDSVPTDIDIRKSIHDL